MSYAAAGLSALNRRFLGPISATLGRLGARSALSPIAVLEAWLERAGGHPAETEHRPHLLAAVEWLSRAQDATRDGGVSRGYSLVRHRYFGARGWQPSYPETTGYIIPTLYLAARHLNRPDLAARATRAAAWEVEIQLASGGVRAGVIGERESPAVFNTGQVMLGWLSAWEETGDRRFAAACRRAARYLVSALDADGLWRRGNSRFARADATLYNARAAWALAEAGVRLGEPEFVVAAAKNLREVARRQRENGWLPDCCLTDPDRPLLHTLAYAVRGLLEGGRVLGDHRLTDRATLTAERLAATVDERGWMPGRLGPDWGRAAQWSCLTGEAQMANVWLRLREITGASRWLEPVAAVLGFLKATQNRTSRDPGLRGGIKGSAPLGGDYGRYEVLSWATKFFVDALIRDERIRARMPPLAASVWILT